MSYYVNANTRPRSILIEQGWPVYLFGSRQSITSDNYITNVAITAGVATVSVENFSGPLPSVGAFASIRGSQVSGGVFNVTNALITATNLNPAGVGTVSFAITNADVASVVDAGMLSVRGNAVGDVFTTNGAASIAGAVGNVVGRNGNFLSAQVFLPTGAATVDLQGSNSNNDADFATIANVAITNGRGGVNVTTSFAFVRFNVSAVTTAGTIVGSITA